MAAAVQRLKSPVRSRIPSRDRALPSLPPVDVSGLELRSKTRKADIGGAVTGGELERTIEGASTLTLDVFDADGVLLNSPILVDSDPVDVQLDRFWFRLVRVSKQATTLTLTFEDREVSLMRLITRPRRAFRGDVTRAEFVLSMLKETGGDDGRKVKIPFYIPELHVSQRVGGRPVPADDPAPKPKDKAKPSTKQGFSSGDVLPGKGGVGRLTPYQMHNAEIALSVADHLNAPKHAKLALIEACLVEAPNFSNPSGGEGTSQGILQLTAGKPDRRNIVSVVERFLQVGFYSHGGAISNARANPGKSPGQIAQETQGSAFGSRYEQERKYADRILAAYGGGGGSGGGTPDRTVTAVKRYAFTRGSVKKRESSWTAAQRLAEEVQWRAFMNEGRFYFVSEEALYRAKPKLTLSEASEGVTSIDFDADQNVAVSEATVACRAGMWVADPGTVVKLLDLGRASKDNWLVASMRRGVFDRDTTITLKQPMAEKPEPAPETSTKTIPGTKGRGGSAGAGGGPVRDRIIRVAESSLTSKTGFSRYSQAGALTEDLTPRTARTDCSQWIRAVYLKAGAGDPGSNTYQMVAKGKRTTRPRPGDIMLTANNGHCEIFVGGDKTYGHGSPPIDAGSVKYFAGAHFVTYDFLDK